MLEQSRMLLAAIRLSLFKPLAGPFLGVAHHRGDIVGAGRPWRGGVVRASDGGWLIVGKGWICSHGASGSLIGKND